MGADPKIASEVKEDEILEQAGRLTVHGTTKIVFSSNKIIRGFWICLLVLGTLGAARGLYMNLTEYMDSPILTAYEIKQASPKFPEITICPFSPINKEKVDLELKHPYIGSCYLKAAEDGTLLGAQSTIWESSSMFEGLGGSGFKGDPTEDILPLAIDKYFLEVGFEVNQFFRQCSFSSKSFDCAKKIERVFDKDYGVCFVVKMDTGQIAAGGGLQLVIDLHSDLRTFRPLLNAVGVRINERYDVAETTAKQFYVNAGGMTTITMSPKLLNLINYKSGTVQQSCRENDQTPYEFQVLTNVHYTEAACRMDCIQKTVNKVCNCSLPLQSTYLKSEWSTHCINDEIKDCYLTKMIIGKQKADEVNACTRKCLAPCTSWKYEHHSSFIPFSEDSSTHELHSISEETSQETSFSAADMQRMNKDLIILDISFKKLQYTEVTQTYAMTIVTFLSNLGGQLGLWLGASVLSLIQIIVLLVLWIYDAIKSQKKKRNKLKSVK